jgi:hypothetical protein
MSNIVNGIHDEKLGSGDVVKVSFVDRQGNLLGEQDYTKNSIEEARDIPKGNQIPYLPKREWRIFDISADGKTWTIDVVPN